MKIKLISILLILALLFSFSGCIVHFADDPTPNSEEEEDGAELGGDGSGNGDGDDGDGGDGDGDGGYDAPITPTVDGYTFPTEPDTEVHTVNDIYEASALIDIAIKNHRSSVILDFSPLGEEYDPLSSFENQCEFASHVWLKYTRSDDTPKQLTVTINYRKGAASKAMTRDESNVYYQIASANELAVLLSANASQRRSENFEAFPIDLSGRETAEVYNSEELWWVIEKGYKPSFPIENSSAERIYEKARAVLREIITEDMSDFEKALAIYEYLIRAVDYDYDSYYDSTTLLPQENVCYYLEGVFDYGRAVCDGKSKAFVLLCGIEGIEAVRDFGYGITSGTGHAWNYVNIDGVWYAVDTTNGDVASDLSESGIPAFYGKNIQLINYKLFLTTLSLYEGKYEYSGLWSDILATDAGLTRTADVLSGRRVDFYIDSAAELSALISLMEDSDTEEFLLVVDFSPLVSLFYGTAFYYKVMNEALSMLGGPDSYEFAVWTESLGSGKNYMYTFKPKATETAPK